VSYAQKGNKLRILLSSSSLYADLFSLLRIGKELRIQGRRREQYAQLVSLLRIGQPKG